MPDDAQRSTRLAKKACVLVIMGVVFNAFLALVNAHVTSLSEGIVTLTQGLILLYGGLLVWTNQKKLQSASAPMGFLFAAACLFMLVSAANQDVYLKSLGDMAIIGIFFMLGGLTDEKTLIKTFRILSWAVLAFMILEIASTNAYVAILQPADYYENTRGLVQSKFNDTGLFANALGYQGRFSFHISDHRLASLFLEQVSLANFAMVLSIVTVTFWKTLTKNERRLFLATILLAVVGTSSRTATVFVLGLAPGYIFFPRLPKKSALLVIPAILFFSAILFYDPQIDKDHLSDDMSGRIGLTMSYLANLEISDLLIGNVKQVAESMDSGYTYLICSQTVFGLILFWLFTSRSVKDATPENKRFIYFMNLYLGVCLLIGAAVFSIKTNAPLWFVAGYLQNKYARESATAKPALLKRFR